MVEEMPLERCGNCRFWKKQTYDSDYRGDTAEGYCRRYPKILLLATAQSHELDPDTDDTEHDRSYWWKFPVCAEEEWCGEWQAAGTGAAPRDPVGIVDQLHAGAIQARIEELARQREALLVLLRAAQRRESS